MGQGDRSMILRGAHVVDGWAEEMATRCCSELATWGCAICMRRCVMSPDARILVVDRSRKFRPPKSGRLRRSRQDQNSNSQ